MTVKRFVTKRVEIDAMQYVSAEETFDDMCTWTESNFRLSKTVGGWVAQVYDKLHTTWINVSPGQWIVRGAKGEYYPCDDETFHWKYEEVKPVDPENSIRVGKNLLSARRIEINENVISPNEARRMNGMEER